MGNRKLAPLFFVLALLARTVQFKLTQCIVHNKIPINIICADQTGPGSVEQAGPDRVDQGSARQGRAGPSRVEQSNARQGRAEKGQTGLDSVRQDWARPDSVEQCQEGPDGQRQTVRAEQRQTGLERSDKTVQGRVK